MKIFYWSPFTSSVATIKAVINSAHSLKNLYNYDTYLINSFGEWGVFKEELKQKKIKIISNLKGLKIKNTEGFLNSRITYLKIFFNSLLFLKYILKIKKPKFLIIHLLTSLPLTLFLIFNFETKLVLRISGLPKLNFLRRFLWRISNKNISFITVPTKETLKNIKKLNLFDSNKIYYLPDPVIIKKELFQVYKNKKKTKDRFILNIGRLTKQKNQKLLIKSFDKISKKYKNLKLLILGDGEKFSELKKLTTDLNLNSKIKFLGHVNNPYEYIKKSLCVVVSSLWEDPGFVMIEASALKRTVICSDCASGPKEFFNDGKTGFLFKNNDPVSFIQVFDKFMKTNKNIINFFIKKNFENSLKFTDTFHGKCLKQLLDVYEKK